MSEEDWKAYHARQEEIWAELDREAQIFRITKGLFGLGDIL
jgi:hypothetical protein